jgi:MFS family permease
VFAALRYRDFRLLWSGFILSYTGTFMQSAAMLWHVSVLVPENRRALALGFVGLARIVPIIVFSLISGVAADALNRRILMLGTQSIMALLAAVLAVLTFRGLDAVWPIYVLAACSSAVGAFDTPARQALVPTLVDRKDLANAISLNTIAIQLASVIGPAAGGLMIAYVDVGWVYAFNALSFLAVIAATSAWRPHSTACASCSARRSSVRRCCSISLQHSFHPRRRCCRSSRRTCCTSAPAATGGSTRPPRPGRS